MSTLQGRSISESYKDLLQISNNNEGLDDQLRAVLDGEGDTSSLYVSTSSIQVSGTSIFNGNVGIGTDSPSEAFVIKGDDKRMFIASDDYNLFSIGRRGVSELDSAYMAMYDEGVKKVSVDTAGDTFFNGGNVGVGTSSPATKLHVVDDSTWDAFNIGSSNDTGAGFTMVNSSRWSLLSTGVSAGAGEDKLGFHLSQAAAGSGGVNGYKMVIDVDGNVGIGTTSPGQSLAVGAKVSGDTNARTSLASFNASDNAFLEIENTSTQNPAGIILTNVTTKKWTIAKEGDDHNLFIKDASDSVVATFLQGGNVGIGTTNPTDAFVIKGDDKRMSIASDDYNLVTIGRRGVNDLDAGYLSIYDEGAIKVSVDPAGDTFFNGGNVGIGTSSPSTDLHCENATSVSTLRLSTGTSTGYSQIKGGGTTGSFTIEADPTDSVAGSVISLGTDGTEKMRIDSDGNVGIGTTTPDATLHVRAKDDSENALALWVVNKAHNNSIISAYENGDVRLGSFTYDDATGSVGIGTTSPQQELDINGKIQTRGVMQNVTDDAEAFEAMRDEENTITLTNNGHRTSHSIGASLGSSDVTADNSGLYIGAYGVGSNATNVYVKSAIHLDNHYTASKGLRFFTGDGSTQIEERMCITRSGNVGIGTSNPATPLELQFTDSEVYTGSVGGNALRVRNLSQDTDTFSSLELMAGQTNAGGVHLARIFAIKESTSNTATSLAVNTRASDGVVSEKMRIDSNGNVGIGTTSPAGKLEVYTENDNTGSTYGNQADSLLLKNTSDMVGAGPKLIFYNANNPGSPSSSPSALIGLQRVNTANNRGDLVFHTRGTIDPEERMRIDSNGNVGVGTTGPGQKFEVKCDASQYNIFALSEHDTAGWGALHGGRMEYTMPGSSSASSRSWAIGKYRPTDAVHACTVLQLKSRDNGTAHLWMDDNNVLRFGTNSSNIGSTTGTSLGTAGTSDERAKNIEPGFEYGLDHVMQLQPIAFTFKKDAEQTRTLGFGASASQQIIPESVFDTGNCVDGYDEHPEHEDMNQPKSDDTELGMDYVQLIPVLTKAIQELKAENDALKARVEALETPAE